MLEVQSSVADETTTGWRGVANQLLESSRHMFLFSILGFKFMEWWYGNDQIAQSFVDAVVPVPPPTPPPPVAGSYMIPKDHALCAICLNRRSNPTIVPSGYVFCYRCVYDYVTQHQRCPITFIPVSLEQLRRVYEST
eukprot:c16215_g1_i3.p1 GENE.c16215_g1_i3~~c16215_g1_i3.p1  ORF type:complete len:137 (-),score=26.82 c16215_g1_i3:66-476(-)